MKIRAGQKLYNQFGSPRRVVLMRDKRGRFDGNWGILNLKYPTHYPYMVGRKSSLVAYAKLNKFKSRN